MIQTSKQKTQIQAHHTITESATQTHTQKQTKDYVHGIWYRGRSSSGAESWLFEYRRATCKEYWCFALRLLPSVLRSSNCFLPRLGGSDTRPSSRHSCKGILPSFHHSGRNFIDKTYHRQAKAAIIPWPGMVWLSTSHRRQFVRLAKGLQ